MNGQILIKNLYKWRKRQRKLFFSCCRTPIAFNNNTTFDLSEWFVFISKIRFRSTRRGVSLCIAQYCTTDHVQFLRFITGTNSQITLLDKRAWFEAELKSCLRVLGYWSMSPFCFGGMAMDASDRWIHGNYLIYYEHKHLRGFFYV